MAEINYMKITTKDFDNVYNQSHTQPTFIPSNDGLKPEDELKFWYKNGKLYGLSDSYTHQEFVENDMPTECHEDLSNDIQDYIDNNNINEHDNTAVADAIIKIACKHGWIRISRIYSDVIVNVYDMTRLDGLKNAVLDFPEIFKTKYSNDIKLVDCISNKYHIFHNLQDLLTF